MKIDIHDEVCEVIVRKLEGAAWELARDMTEQYGDIDENIDAAKKKLNDMGVLDALIFAFK